ncbi:MAG: MFS transporter [Candidatus Helarchaeota archaeon]
MEIENQSLENSPDVKLHKNSNLLIVFGITLMAVLGVSSITPAFPNIVRVLGITNEAVGLLISVFTLPSVILAPVMGIFADRIGRKRILVPSLFLFGIAGFSCLFVRDFNQLLILRFFQGIGAASLGTINLTILGDLYSGKDLSNAMGYNGAITSIGTAMYPIIGGALANIKWSYPFLLPILAVPIGLFVLFFLENPEPKDKEDLKHYLSSAIRSMGNRHIIGLYLASFTVFILVFGSILTYVPILIDGLYNISPFIIYVSPFSIGVIISSLSISASITSGMLGKLTNYFREKTLVISSFVLYGSALLIIPIIPQLWLYLIPLIIFGIAQGINVPSVQTLVADSSSLEHRAIYMSVNGMFIFLGQTIGPLLMGFVFLLWGLSSPFVIGAIFSIFMFLFLLIMLK